jgi:hypothetical protein
MGGPCHHGVARPRVADEGDDIQIWKVVVNTLNKQLRTANKGWASGLGVGRGANNSSSYKHSLLRNVTKGVRIGQSF